MQISRISASGFSKLDECQWAYFLSYVVGIESSAGPSALLGTLSHKVLELLSTASLVHHRTDSKIWNPEYLWQICFNHYCNESPEIAAGIKKDKIKIIYKGLIETINGPYSPICNNTISVEQYFRLELKEKRFKLPNGDHLCVSGRIDRIDQIDENTIEVLDYKSGSRSDWLSSSKVKKNSEELKKSIQAQLYYLAAKELYPWAKNIIITFIYFTDGGPIPAYFDESDILDIKDRLEKRLYEILSNDDPKLNKSWRCRFCSYYNGVCESIDAERKEMGFEMVQAKYITLKNIVRK